MAKFTHLFISVTLVLLVTVLVNIHGLPANEKIVSVSSDTGESVVAIDPVEIVTSCGDHGTPRVNATGCNCDRGWADQRNTTESHQFCTYRQRSKQTAFFLSLFLGSLGADWFYLSRSSLAYIIVGILKLLLGCGCCSSWPLLFFGPDAQNKAEAKQKLRGVSTFFALVAFAWWLVDWARILGDRFPDGNHEKLMPW